MRLIPRDKGGEVFIMSQKGPAITISLKQREKCTLIDLKIGYHGPSSGDEFKEKTG